ncbi:aromatic ring-hydroxylating oxygenase subunit alpha [Alicyclobacillus mengziensis]|uniref:Aromatic ring-hydroxylating dioxygenase subunit alpha n=1 Tax=Alicyclobacillus mengziensis TaxID=2931921 RepID=A0A9X7VW94_9BACL|nr:aromatic ring-hydroxylating dioxygenase subunit alpha [Alicyclobacillus mengziensis]QSO46030.1 aromatic ring-hydroxylating dioxygenase subunit alpha [Alicyclobacillus mengziensis]
MLRHAWYAVIPSKDLGSTPLKATVCDTDLVLFRDSAGAPHAFLDQCPHRGCNLSIGKVADDRLVCAYHGWHFDENGHCVHVPANRAGMRIPHSAKLQVFPACDTAGLTWVYASPVLSGNLFPELALFPELSQKGWRYVPFEALWSANFCRVVESAIDVSHLPFVHPETTGEDVSPVVYGPDYRFSEYGIVIHPTPFAPTHPMEVIPTPEGVPDRTEIALLFPNNWMIRTPMGDDNWMCTFLTFCPVGRSATKIFGIAMRNFDIDSEFLDDFHVEHTEFVMEQDRCIVERLKPVEPPLLKYESHVPADAPSIRFRTMLFKALKQENT